MECLVHKQAFVFHINFLESADLIFPGTPILMLGRPRRPSECGDKGNNLCLRRQSNPVIQSVACQSLMEIVRFYAD
jgi:hypothetical protein